MIKNFVVYNVNGVILRQGICNESDVPNQAWAPGETAIEGDGNDAAHYVDPETQTITPKKTMTATLSGQTITGLPANTTAVVNENDQFLITDGTAEFSFTAQGIYEIVCSAPQYLDKTFVVEVA